MSASREKKKRQNTPEAVVFEQPEKKGMPNGLKKAVTAVVAVVLVALVVFFALFNSGFLAAHTTAAVVDGHKLSPAMVNYFYGTAYNQVYNDLGQLLDYIVDPAIPMADQAPIYEGYETWGDYLTEQGLNAAAELYALYDAAIEEGMTVTPEMQAQIDSDLENLSTSAKLYGYGDLNSLLVYQYGNGCNEKNYREYLTVAHLAQEYSNAHLDSMEYTQEEIDAYYGEHSENYDAVTYRMYDLYEEVVDGGKTGEEILADLEAASNEMVEASKGNEEAYIALTVDNAPEEDKADYEDADATLLKNQLAAHTSDDIAQWLFDEARQPGDTTAVSYSNDAEAGYHVLYFVEKTSQNYEMPAVRHILITADKENATAEELAAAQTRAEEILDEYLNGEKTEEAFAGLALAHSEDNAEDGGLYENIVKGQMVAEFEDWCFDPARQEGDTGIVQTTYGYHIMYFCGTGDSVIVNDMKNDGYEAWINELTADATIETNALFMGLINKF